MTVLRSRRSRLSSVTVLRNRHPRLSLATVLRNRRPRLYMVARIVDTIEKTAASRWGLEVTVVLDIPFDAALALLCAEMQPANAN